MHLRTNGPVRQGYRAGQAGRTGQFVWVVALHWHFHIHVAYPMHAKVGVEHMWANKRPRLTYYPTEGATAQPSRVVKATQLLRQLSFKATQLYMHVFVNSQVVQFSVNIQEDTLSLPPV